MHPQTILLLTLGTLTHATQPLLRAVSPPTLFGHSLSPADDLDLAARQSRTCGTGQRVCETGCMPTTATCCNTGKGGFCPSGYFCDGNGCCENGKRCSGPPIGCPKGSVLCRLECVAEGTCPGGGSGSGSGSGSGTTTRTSTTRTSTRTSTTRTSTTRTSATRTSTTRSSTRTTDTPTPTFGSGGGTSGGGTTGGGTIGGSSGSGSSGSGNPLRTSSGSALMVPEGAALLAALLARFVMM